METIIVCFETGTSAAQFKREAERRGIPGRLSAAPRALQASCALAWVSPQEHESAALALAETIPHGVVARYDWGGVL